MRINSKPNEKGSVLVTAMMTMTILALICATSLFISRQNMGTGMQVAGWQQALTAAESGMDAAVRALNADHAGSSAWTNWKNVTGSLPVLEPTSASSSAGKLPSFGNYTYLPSTAMSLDLPNTEGSTQMTAWVTIDTSGGNLKPSASGSQQWFRIRSIGKAVYPNNSMLLTRASNNRLDNELRNSIAMNFVRKNTVTNAATNGNSSSIGPTRTIEAVMSPQGGGVSIWQNGVVLQNALSMSGGGTMGHYNSKTVSTANLLASPNIYRSTDYTETIVAMLNGNGADLKNTYVYGAMAYSTTGAVPKNTSNVQGPISSPYNGTTPNTSDPTWGATPDITYTGGGSLPFTSLTPGSSNNSAAKPYKVKLNGDFAISGGKSLAITSPNSGNQTTYIEIWVTGSFAISGSGVINQDPSVHVTYYVDGGVSVSGSSFNNQSGLAQNNQMIVVGSGDVAISGSGNYVGTVQAPNSKFSISGSGALIGGLIGKTLDISGGASVYVDDALAQYTANGGSVAPTSYAFASWFEDNSDPIRNSYDTSFNWHPIIY